MKIILMVIFIALFNVLLFAQTQKADFFIAQDLSRFEILNRYQQKISSTEKQKFGDYTPWKIINRNMVLGDQFTRAMQVEFKGEPFYFVLNEDGAFKNEPETFHEIFENCQIITDEINVIKEKGVLFREVPFSNKGTIPRTYLDSGIQVRRLFKKGQSYFVQIIQTGIYGWIRINNLTVIASADQTNQQNESSFSEEIFKQVENKVEEVNQVYSQLFKHLNSEFGENKSAPLWKMKSGESDIILSLENINGEKLKKSSVYLVNDIENIFSGLMVSISTTPDTIKISLNDEN